MRPKPNSFYDIDPHLLQRSLLYSSDHEQLTFQGNEVAEKNDVESTLTRQLQATGVPQSHAVRDLTMHNPSKTPSFVASSIPGKICNGMFHNRYTQ